MGKIITVLFFLFISIAFLVTYIVITQKINQGAAQIVIGEEQLAKGKKMLAEGKARLASGKQKLSRAKKIFNPTGFGVALVTLPVTGVVYLAAKNKISEGDKMVARGAANVSSGEKRLAAGEKSLFQGKQQIIYANKLRMMCGAFSSFFFLLTLIAGFYWRTSFRELFLKLSQKKSV